MKGVTAPFTCLLSLGLTFAGICRRAGGRRASRNMPYQTLAVLTLVAGEWQVQVLLLPPQQNSSKKPMAIRKSRVC